MKELNADMLRRLSVIRNDHPHDIIGLYESALEAALLSEVDYLTIRDLVAVSGHDEMPVHALLLCMFSVLAEGSICLRLEPAALMKRLGQFTDNNKKTAETIQKKFSTWSGLIYKAAPGESFISNSESFKPLVLSWDESRLYFHKYYVYEGLLKDQLRRMLGGDHAHSINDKELLRILYTVLVKKPLHFYGEPAVMSNEQAQAILMPLTKNFVVISGGPGTGKTSIVLNILRTYTRKGADPARIFIAAPTGRAAQRLTDSVRKGLASLHNDDREDRILESLQGVTLHRLLRYSPGRNAFTYNKHHRLRADLVIIDEVSMIDIILLVNLMQSLDEDTTLVFLGDRNQLPSVGAGSILADLMPSDDAPLFSTRTRALLRELLPRDRDEFNDTNVREEGPFADRFISLTKSFRSEKTINDIAERINQQDLSVLDDIPSFPPDTSLPLSGTYRIQPQGTGAEAVSYFSSILSLWFKEQYRASVHNGPGYTELIQNAALHAPDDFTSNTFQNLMKSIFYLLDRGRVLTPVKHGFYGTAWINRYMSALLAEQGRLQGNINSLYSGEPIIITKNDYKRNLYNGDVGVILMDKGNDYYAFFPRSHGFDYYPAAAIADYEPAYAITVHKSQGSEYERVLVVTDESARRLLTREILYTAMTRARSLVLIYGTDEMMRRAVSNRIIRDSGISIRELFQ